MPYVKDNDENMNDSSIVEHIGTIWLTLALATGSMESILLAAKWFEKVGYIPIVSSELMRMTCFALDYLHTQMLGVYSEWTNQNAMSKWLCERCGTLNQFTSDICKSNISLIQYTQTY